VHIAKLMVDSNFFDSPKLVKDVLLYIESDLGLKADSVHVSVVLKRFSEAGN